MPAMLKKSAVTALALFILSISPGVTTAQNLNR